MPRRLLVVGVTWLTAFGLFAAVIVWSARPRPTPTPPAVTDLVRALNRMETPNPSAKHEPWTVIKAMSARHEMVIEVEADQPGTARQIAEQLLEPLRGKYEEVLIYVRPIGSPANTIVRRIQWTPDAGLIETTY
jgi:hypothetical protein